MTAAAAEAEYVDLPIADVTPNPDQPRKLFAQDALDELAASIREHGLLQPIAVRPVDGRYVIIAGERRWRATQLAGLTSIPARIVNGLDDAKAFALSMVENLNRADMTDMEEARGYAAMRDHGATVGEIARLTGKTTKWVQMYLDLLELSPELQHLLDAKGIKIGVAWSFSRISKAGQQVALRKYLAGDFASDRDAQHYATAVRDQEGQGGLFDEPATPEERAEQARNRKALMTKLAKLAQAWEVCAEIAKLDPVEVAAALAGDGGAATYRDHMSMVVSEANKALGVLRRAVAADAAYRSSIG